IHRRQPAQPVLRHTAGRPDLGQCGKLLRRQREATEAVGKDRHMALMRAAQHEADLHIEFVTVGRIRSLLLGSLCWHAILPSSGTDPRPGSRVYCLYTNSTTGNPGVKPARSAVDPHRLVRTSPVYTPSLYLAEADAKGARPAGFRLLELEFQPNARRTGRP